MTDKPINGKTFRTGAKRSADRLTPAPVRTCVVCRQRDLRSVLLRLKRVAADLVLPETSLGVIGGDQYVQIDRHKNAGGRGAWVHPQCLPRLQQKHLLTAYKVR